MTAPEPVPVFDERQLEQILGNDYQVVSKLGSGSNRDAWLAKQNGKLRAVLVDITPKTQNSQRTQLKGLDTSNEVAAYAKLNNTHEDLDAQQIIPLIHSVNVESVSGTRRIAVMQYANKGTLEEICKTDISVGEKLKLFKDLAKAIAATHAAGLFQRDIKPTNSVVDLKDGKLRAYLSDFNIAIPMELVTDNTPYSQTRGGHATVDPNVLVGKPFNVTSDLYSFGKTMLACLTNSKTFEFDRRDGHLIGIDHLNKASLLTPDEKNIDPVAYKAALKSALNQLPKKAKKVKKMLESMLSLDQAKRVQSASRVYEMLDEKTTPFWKKEMFWGCAASAGAIILVSSWAGGNKLYTKYQTDLRDAQTFKVVQTYAADQLNILNNQFYVSASIWDFSNRRTLAEIANTKLPANVTIEEARLLILKERGYSAERPYSENAHTGVKPVIIRHDDPNSARNSIRLGVRPEETAPKNALTTNLKGRIYVPGYDGKEFETTISPRDYITGIDYKLEFKINDIVPKEFSGSGFIYIDIISPQADLKKADKPEYPTYNQAIGGKLSPDEFQVKMRKYDEEKNLREVDYPNEGYILSRLAIPIIANEPKLVYVGSAHYFEWYAAQQSQAVTGIQMQNIDGTTPGIKEDLIKRVFSNNGQELDSNFYLAESYAPVKESPKDASQKLAVLYMENIPTKDTPKIVHMTPIRSDAYTFDKEGNVYRKTYSAMPNDRDYKAFIAVRKMAEQGQK